MRNILTCAILVASLASFGCGGNEAGAVTNAKNTSTQSAISSSNTETDKVRQEESSTTTIAIQIGQQQFQATLDNTPTTDAFLRKLPLTMDMTELNGNEKYYILDEGLPTQDEAVREIHTGDLMLYNGRYVVLFYKDFSTSYRYTRLGKINSPEGLAQAVGKGDIQISVNR